MQPVLDWAKDNIELVIAVGSAIAAIIGAGFSARAAGRVHRLQQEKLRADIDMQSMTWGHEAIDVLGAAGELALARDSHLSRKEFRQEQTRLAAKLSTLADRGRLFFPNIADDGHGADKESAFKGHRPPILYALIYAYYEVRAMDEPGRSGTDACEFLFKCRRHFVSELQAHLDPRRRNEVVERYDHLEEHQREDALDTAARLGVILDARRPGTLTRYNDSGMVVRIPEEERRKILLDQGLKES